jgi:regulator of protease activity HflC (stomatin/prohibitin superfamily)
VKRRRKRSSQAAARKGGPSIYLFFGAVFLAAILGYLGRDYLGVRFGWLGATIWIFALVFAFVGGLAYQALFILPLSGDAGWNEGLRLLLTNWLRSLEPNRRVPAIPKELEDIPASLPKFGAGIVESHHALALTRHGAFSRAAGPGFVRLNRNEHISHVVDLRPHLVNRPVKAITRDGIPLDTSVTVVYQIRQLPEAQAPADVAYCYDNRAIFEATYFGQVSKDGAILPWGERLTAQAETLLVGELSHWTLDELFRPSSATGDALARVGEKLTAEMVERFGKKAFDILRVSIGRLEPSAEVSEQRLQTWQAEWQRRVTLRQAAGDAEAARRLKLARAKAQIEVIERLTENIDAVRHGSEADLTEVITLRMISALEQAASDANVQALVPQQMLTTLTEVRRWLNQPPEEPGLHEPH